MLCYVKDGKTFATKLAAHAEYDVTVRSVYDETSTVTLPCVPCGGAAAGDLVFVDGLCGVVREVENRFGAQILTCDDALTLLCRKLFVTQDSGAAGVEQFLKRQIEENFTQINDPAYRLDFLRVETQTCTPADLPPDEEQGLWSVRAYAEKARALLGIYTQLAVAGDTLRVVIGRAAGARRNIDLSLSQFEVTEESVSAAQTARISVLAEDTREITDWYLLEDESISAELPKGRRAAGEWERITVEKADQAERAARERFAKNSASHIIEFATLNEYGFGDECVIRLRDGRTLKSYISALRKKSGDERTHYKAGGLRPLIGQTLRNRFGG